MISVIIPTYNESGNLEILLDRIFEELKGVEAEVVVVDDNSPDGTGELAESLKQKHPVQVLHRSGKLGLASAVLDGMKAAKGNILAVIDADLSHDPSILPHLHSLLQNGTDLAVGSRHVPGGGTKGWPLFRQMGSRFAISLARPITRVKDATSGYFAFRRSVVEGVPLDALGFKIGLEIFVKGRYKNWKEVPYVFQDRQSGKSKLNKKVVLEYLKHLIKLYWWKITLSWRRDRHRS